MNRIIITLLMILSFSSSAMVLDSDRVWREHIITDATTQQTISLVGYLPKPDEQDQPIPYILHIGAMQRHEAFYMNISSMIDNFHPRSKIVITVGDHVKYFNAQDDNKYGIAESIRVSDSTMTFKMFSYEELNTCTGEYYNLVNSDNINVNYVTTAGDVRDINIHTDRLIGMMQHVYKIPDSCTDGVLHEDTSTDDSGTHPFNWYVIVTLVMLMWSIHVGVLAKSLGRRRWLWFLFGFFCTPIVSHITLKIISKKSTKSKEV